MSGVTNLLTLMRSVGRHPLGSRHRLRSYGRIIEWQVRSRLTRRSLERPWFGGATLMVRKGMHGATGNVYFGLYEFADMGLALHLLRPDDLFVDIGANVGVFTVLASKVCGSRTVAFEPAIETMADLRANVLANDLADRVELREEALGEADGEVHFSMGLDCVNHVVIDPVGGSVRTVPARRLDTALRGRRPTLLKIDVEGFEHAVIAGASAILVEPSLLAIEIETVTDDTRALIEGAGFAEVYYDPFKRLLLDAPRFEAGNRLFVRDRESVQARVTAAPCHDVQGIML